MQNSLGIRHLFSRMATYSMKRDYLNNCVVLNSELLRVVENNYSSLVANFQYSDKIGSDEQQFCWLNFSAKEYNDVGNNGKMDEINSQISIS